MDAAGYAPQPAAPAAERAATNVPAGRGPDSTAGNQHPGFAPIPVNDPAPTDGGEQCLDVVPRGGAKGGRETAPVGRAGQEARGLRVQADERRTLASRFRELINRLQPKPKPVPPPPAFQIHIFPKVTWWNLPQRIA